MSLRPDIVQYEESTYSQKESKVRVILGLVDESGEVGRLWHMGRGDRVQVGDDGLGIGVGARAGGQSGKSGIGVELEERGLKVGALQEVDLFGLDVDAELSAGRDIRIRYLYPLFGRFWEALTQRSRQRRPRRSGRKRRELAVERNRQKNRTGTMDWWRTNLCHCLLVER